MHTSVTPSQGVDPINEFRASRLCRTLFELLYSLASLPSFWRGEETHVNVYPQAMDHEKPEAVSHHILEYDTGEMSRSTDYSDLQLGRTPSPLDIDEVEQVEERRERRGENVW